MKYEKIELFNKDLILCHATDKVLRLDVYSLPDFKIKDSLLIESKAAYLFNIKAIDSVLYIMTSSEIVCLDTHMKPIWKHTGKFEPLTSKASKKMVVIEDMDRLDTKWVAKEIHDLQGTFALLNNWVHDDLICTSSSIAKYNIETGDMIWEKEVDSWYRNFRYEGDAPITGDSIIVLAKEELKILDLATGKERSSLTLEDNEKFKDGFFHNGYVISQHLDSLYGYQLK